MIKILIISPPPFSKGETEGVQNKGIRFIYPPQPSLKSGRERILQTHNPMQ